MLCERYSVLLDRHSIASTKYHQATCRLFSLAGQSKPDRFAEAKQNCEAIAGRQQPQCVFTDPTTDARTGTQSFSAPLNYAAFFTLTTG